MSVLFLCAVLSNVEHQFKLRLAQIERLIYI